MSNSKFSAPDTPTINIEVPLSENEPVSSPNNSK